jgi:hypothetical protein
MPVAALAANLPRQRCRGHQLEFAGTRRALADVGGARPDTVPPALPSGLQLRTHTDTPLPSTSDYTADALEDPESIEGDEHF